MTKEIIFGIPGFDNNKKQQEVLGEALLEKLDFCFHIEYGELRTVIDSEAGNPQLLHIHLYCEDSLYNEAKVHKAYTQIADEFNVEKGKVKFQVNPVSDASFG